MLDFQKLNTPSGDGDILIEPPADEWRDMLRANRDVLAGQSDVLAGQSVSLAGQQIHDVRCELRQGRLKAPQDKAIIAAGHQPEFIHPGVWAKHVVVHALAAREQAFGLDLVVDNDAPHDWSLQIPVIESECKLRLQSIPFATAATGAAFEGRAWVDEEAKAEIISSVREAMGQRWQDSLMPAYFDGLRNLENRCDAVDQHMAGRAKVDVSLSADLAERRVSSVFGGPFLADLLLNAARFAEAYNEALQTYRKEQQVRSPDRPLPDLIRDGDRIETALWAYQPGRPRCRLWVKDQQNSLALFADESAIGEISKSAISQDVDRALADLMPWRIRPRALSLTLWARLLACDLFVHGIGGAKYDRITDTILETYYESTPSKYGCVTATLQLPLPTPDVTIHDVRQAQHRLRDWHFNPERYADDLPEPLLKKREALIEQSESQRKSQASSLDRRDTFLAIRDTLQQLTAPREDVRERLADALAEQEQALASRAIAESREYFYCLQPRDRLEALAEKLIDRPGLSR